MNLLINRRIQVLRACHSRLLALEATQRQDRLKGMANSNSTDTLPKVFTFEPFTARNEQHRTFNTPGFGSCWTAPQPNMPLRQ